MTMRKHKKVTRSAALVGTCLAAVVLVGCGSTEDQAPTATATAQATTTTSARSTTSAAVAPATSPVAVPGPAGGVVAPASSASATAAPVLVAMPNVMCMNLQAAQDLIQEQGVFFSRSKDATGQGRRQVLDANWVVVGQTPTAGELIGEGDAVLSVVKIGESTLC